MDREFILYLLNELYHNLPLEGPAGRIDLWDRAHAGEYRVSEARTLLVPLGVEPTGDPTRRVRFEVELAGLLDEEHDLEQLWGWIAQWRRAMAVITPEELPALSAEELSVEAVCGGIAATLNRRLEDLHGAFGELLSRVSPVGSSMRTIAWVECLLPELNDGWIRALASGRLIMALRLCLLDAVPDAGEMSLRDVKEQELSLRIEVMQQPERFANMLEGWAMALGEVFERSTNPEDWFAVLPAELFDARVWRLKRPVTAEDFAAAFRVKSRQGRLGKKAAAR